jgi:protein gp37
MFDAEGSVSGGSLRISQKDVTVLESVVEAAGRLGFTFKVEESESNTTSTARLVGDGVERARFLAALRPALARKGAGLEGTKVRTGEAVVVSVERSVDVEMVDITTSSRTFVAAGLLTHNCYARELANSERLKASYPAGFTPLLHEQRLDAPAHTSIPVEYRNDSHTACSDGECKICAWRRVFVCSMADLYGRWVPQEWIDRVHTSMLASPHWQYILLTKFPDRYVGLDMPPGAWVGTSVDEQKRVRIAERAFSQLPAGVVKWLSLEPLLEPLEFTDLSVFDWVVIGAQTETFQGGRTVPAFAPPFEWVARIVAQAREAGCRVHLKPNLVNGRPGMQLPDEYPLTQ